MADPLSITASLLAITTAAVQTARSLHDTVKRYRGRDKTLQRLQDELEDLTKILDSLTRVDDADESLLALLKGPVQRCSHVCRDFQSAMEVFNKKSKTGLRDWTRMEFMRGDINEFIETVAGYKSTITVALGTVTIHTSKVSNEVLSQYNEMIQDTAYNLELHMCRIDEKIKQLTVEHADGPSANVDLKDERKVTQQCLRICEDAKTYLQTLSDRASTILHGSTQAGAQEEPFEAPVRMNRVLDESRDSIQRTISSISKRLEFLVQNFGSHSDEERSRLQSDIEISKQCLDVCNIATEASRQKIYKIGEVVADGDSDQMVVTTLADLFDVGKATSTGNSAQLVGSMTAESLRHVTDRRYSSRFGAVPSNAKSVDAVITDSLSPVKVHKSEKSQQPQVGGDEPPAKPGATRRTPSSNEMRKRMPDG